MQQIRIAILGSGFVAEFYLQGLANVAGQTVAAVYSRSFDKAQAFAQRWAIEQATSDLDSLIARNDIDVFIIALPNEAHLPVSLALSKAKRNQVCTKPLGRTAAEALQIWQAAKDSGMIHGYAETEVFAPCVVKAADMVSCGGIGRVLWVRSRESHSGPHSAHFWDVEKTGGGAMNDLGCHCISAARLFFGKQDRIEKVMAWGRRLVHHDKTEGEDNALLLLQFASGGLGHCELSWTTKGGLDLRNEVHGTDGSIFTDVTRSTPITAYTTKGAGYIIEKSDTDSGWTRPLPEEAFAYGYQAEMRHFVECVRDRREPNETYEDGYIVNRILDAGYESMRKAEWVTLAG